MLSEFPRSVKIYESISTKLKAVKGITSIKYIIQILMNWLTFSLSTNTSSDLREPTYLLKSVVVIQGIFFTFLSLSSWLMLYLLEIYCKILSLPSYSN